jgi:hypothetical protein
MSNDETQAVSLPEPLSLLAANERAIEALYQEFARQIPEYEDFWLSMSGEERHHAEIIERLATGSKTAAILQPRFKVEPIRAFSQYVREQQAFARQGTTMAAAISTAYYIETALMERRFFEQLPQQSPAVAWAMTILRKDTERHVEIVKDALTKVRAAAKELPDQK